MTPAVSLGAAGVELVCATAIFMLAPRSMVRLLAIVTCVLLATYQLCELAICRTGGEPWLCRLGFAVIAFLPATTLHMGRLLKAEHMPETRPPRRFWPIGIRWFYITSAALAAWVMIDPRFIEGATCSSFYIHYTYGHELNLVYGTWYELTLIGLIVMLWPARRDRRSRALLIGTVLFFVPSWIVYFILPSTRTAHPSIMCVLAFMLSLMLLIATGAVGGRREPAGDGA